MKCKKCGSELSEEATFCLECGAKIEKTKINKASKNVIDKIKENIKRTFENIKGKNIKEIFIHYRKDKKLWVISVLIIFILLLLFYGIGSNSIESKAKDCIKQLKKIDNVESIDGYACIKNNSEDSKYTFEYVIFYTDIYNSPEYAYFNGELVYGGNGINGGYESGFDRDMNNFNASSATKEVLEFITQNFSSMQEFSKRTHSFDNDEGVIYLKNYNLEDWFDKS